MSSNLQNLLAILGIIVIGGVGYYLYVQDGLVVSATPASQEASILAAEFLGRLNELKTLKLDDSIFNDPRFRGLHDIRAQVTAVPIGRENPFTTSN